MAGKPPRTGNAYKPLVPKKRSPTPKKSYNQRLLSKMKVRLKSPPKA